MPLVQRHLAMLLPTMLIAGPMVSPCGAAPQEVVVDRRGDAGELRGRIEVADEDELRLTTATGAVYRLSWDRVRAVEPPDARLDPMLATAEELWRARSRVERGDTELAEPILQRLFERYRGHSSETARVVAEGLLRCRVARGDTVGAVMPALETARLQAMGVETDAFAVLEPILDDETLLAPGVPPVLPDGPGLDRLHRALESWDPHNAGLAAIAEGYRRSLVLDADGTIRPADAALPRATGASDQAGAALLARLGAAATGEPDVAATTLRRELSEGGWRAAWASFALGAANLRSGFAGVATAASTDAAVDAVDSADAASAEADAERVRRGILQLLRVPALHARDQPWLAGAALYGAASAAARLGDDADALALRRELVIAFPHHPLNARGRLAAPAPESRAGNPETR